MSLHKGLKILILDKSRNSASIVAYMLEAWGYQVDIVHSAQTVIDQLNVDIVPDLILVEVISQDSDIFRLPALVKQLPKWSKIPIVAHSVLSDRTAVANAITLGYRDYIVRPTEPDILREKIAAIINHSTKIDGATYACPVSEKAKVVFEMQLTHVSELGLIGYSDKFFEINSILKLDSNILTEIGVADLPLRVAGCDLIVGGQHKYKVALNFVALSDAGAKAIRLYIIKNAKNIPAVG